ncbi:hypothetical protein GS489_33825 [Rhodococcus hoagii]|nr:hypothetical protein [Prescottella equi]
MARWHRRREMAATTASCRRAVSASQFEILEVAPQRFLAKRVEANRATDGSVNPSRLPYGVLAGHPRIPEIPPGNGPSPVTAYTHHAVASGVIVANLRGPPVAGWFLPLAEVPDD